MLTSFYYGLKLVIAFIYLRLFRSDLLKMRIWTLGEKITEARDNAYWLLQYILSVKPDFPVYYVIKRGSPDEKKLKDARVLYYGSFKHCIYSLAAEKCISGQTHWNIPFYNERGIGALYEKLRNKRQKKIWISHGVKKDKISSYDYRVSGYDLMTVAVKREYDYYKKVFNLPVKKIALTGLCRFDRLYDFTEKNQILIMPTFRGWLRTSNSSKERANDNEIDMFKASSFYSSFSKLLHDERMNYIAKSHDIKIVFYLHYTFQPYSFLFKDALRDEDRDFIVIAERDAYDVQSLLKESRLLITDYSSVFFDFAYMRKPVIYYQFDKNEYRERHYKEGYFSYEKDGFGPVLEKEEDVIESLSQYVNNGFQIDSKYKNRMEVFFVPHDNANCKRTFEVIKDGVY